LVGAGGVLLGVVTESGSMTSSVQRPLRLITGDSVQLVCSPTGSDYDVTSGSGLFAVTWSHNGTTINGAEATARYSSCNPTLSPLPSVVM